ncbi:MAG: electron transport complex subunit RsxE [Christensenellales bacterium]
MKSNGNSINFNQSLKQKGGIIANGIVKNNPVFRLVLGTCPTLAVTSGAVNGMGMGLAATFVLVCSNILVSLLRKVIPDKVRIPAYVLIIATFVTLVQMILQKFIPSLYESLGIYLPLIVVNCIILARAEAFASTNKVLDSALDGLGMGLGFTASLMLIGLIREFLGAGTLFYGELAGLQMGVKFSALESVSMNIFILPAGGFLVFGILMAVINAISDYAKKRKDEREQKQIALIESAEREQRITEAFQGSEEKEKAKISENKTESAAAATKSGSQTSTASATENKISAEGGNE